MTMEPWSWRDTWQDVRVGFAAKGLPEVREDAFRMVAPAGIEVAWLRQIHSAQVVDAHRQGVDGSRGDGDALIARAEGLALAIVTADCVPVLLAGDDAVAAVHAGWRGVASRIVPAALERFPTPPQVAWVGPAICADHYEVGDDVAEQVAAASDPSVVRRRPGQRPHLDVTAAVLWQLRQGGVVDIRISPLCTFQAVDQLWSYRRDGKGGRNVAMIWRR
jgi:YfiH family protein